MEKFFLLILGLQLIQGYKTYPQQCPRNWEEWDREAAWWRDRFDECDSIWFYYSGLSIFLLVVGSICLIAGIAILFKVEYERYRTFKAMRDFQLATDYAQKKKDSKLLGSSLYYDPNKLEDESVRLFKANQDTDIPAECKGLQKPTVCNQLLTLPQHLPARQSQNKKLVEMSEGKSKKIIFKASKVRSYPFHGVFFRMRAFEKADYVPGISSEKSKKDDGSSKKSETQ